MIFFSLYAFFALFVVLILVAIVVYVVPRFFLSPSPSVAKKIFQKQGKLTNVVFDKPAGEIEVPIPLQNFNLFREPGTWLTDMFIQQVAGQKIFSFILHGHTSPFGGFGAVHQTSRHCIVGELPFSCPDVEVAKRHVPNDKPAYLCKPAFSSGLKELDERYAFGGNEDFRSCLSLEMIDWLKKYPFQIIIESGWMLLVDRREVVVPAQESDWKSYMQDVSAWISLAEILNHK